METSAKDATNVEQAFMAMAASIKTRYRFLTFSNLMDIQENSKILVRLDLEASPRNNCWLFTLMNNYTVAHIVYIIIQANTWVLDCFLCLLIYEIICQA